METCKLQSHLLCEAAALFRFKLDWVATLVADPLDVNSNIDTDSDLLSDIIQPCQSGRIDKGTQQKDQHWIGLSNCILPGLGP